MINQENTFRAFLFPILLLLASFPAAEDKFSDTQNMFEGAGVGDLFKSAYGEGRVYEQGEHIGKTEMTQLSAGLQAGASGFSLVVFFEDKAAIDKLTSGTFKFGIKVQAIVLTASADASANTGGSSTTASGGKNNAIIEAGGYQNGMATYTITKGGLMYEATLGGQGFTYKAL